MSRIGLSPIEIPEGVEVKLDNDKIQVKGPKGELSRTLPGDVKINIEDKEVTIERNSDDKKDRSLHGTVRSLIFNMIEGVSKGFQKELEIIGVGYRAQKQGNKLEIGRATCRERMIMKERE